MLLQTNSYLVPRDRLAEHDALMRRLGACFDRLGLEAGAFEVVCQADAEFRPARGQSIRHVQLVRFRDEAHYRSVHDAEAADEEAQQLVRELKRLVDLDVQQRSGHFFGQYYRSADAASAIAGTPPAPASLAEPGVRPKHPEPAVVAGELED